VSLQNNHDMNFIILFKPTSTKPQAGKLGTRHGAPQPLPPPMHGKALKKECCLLGVFRDSGDTPANLLCELNGHLMPCTSCLYGKFINLLKTGYKCYRSVGFISKLL